MAFLAWRIVVTMIGLGSCAFAGVIVVNLFDENLAPPTRFDVNFRVGDIPVRIHPFFWISAAVLGYNNGHEGAEKLLYILVWSAILFISILVHELGHILMGWYFGNRGHIVLTGFCGLAIGASDLPKRWQRIAVSLAGPGAGFLLGALVTGFCWLYSPSFTVELLSDVLKTRFSVGESTAFPPEFVHFALLNLMFINFFWGLVNLLPIWPLDGGKICREVCEHYRDREGMRLSLMISLGVAVGFAALAVVEKLIEKPPLPFLPFLSFDKSWLFGLLFFGILALQSWQLLRFIKRAGPDWDEQEREPRAPWEQDADWWKRGENPWRD
jgi:stage IV sporulation protein FB